MTLITLSARVHFANSVLEEALRSELEVRRLRRPLIVSEARFEGTALRERLSSSFARRMPVTEHQMPAAAGKQATAEAIAQLFADERADVLIACGSARAIAATRHSRSIIMQTMRPDRHDGATRPAARPHFFAVLGIDGLPDPEADLGEPLSRKSFLPDVIFCDPTLTLGICIRESASAAVTAFARCVEAYLSGVFNPPADGAALDGLSRVMTSLPRLLKVRDA